MNTQSPLAFLENAYLSYRKEIDAERQNLPVYPVDIIFFSDETLNKIDDEAYTFLTVSQAQSKYPDLYKTGGFALSPVQPSGVVGQGTSEFINSGNPAIASRTQGQDNAPVQCSICTDFSKCLNCSRLTHWVQS